MIPVWIVFLVCFATIVYVVTSGDLISTAPIVLIPTIVLMFTLALVVPRLNAARRDLPDRPSGTPYNPKQPTISKAEREQLESSGTEISLVGGLLAVVPIVAWVLMIPIADRLPDPLGTIIVSLAIGFSMPYLVLRMWRLKLEMPDSYRDYPYHRLIEFQLTIVSWVVKIAAIVLGLLAPLFMVVFVLEDRLAGVMFGVGICCGLLFATRLQNWLDSHRDQIASQPANWFRR